LVGSQEGHSVYVLFFGACTSVDWIQKKTSQLDKTECICIHWAVRMCVCYAGGWSYADIEASIPISISAEHEQEPGCLWTVSNAPVPQILPECL